MDNLFSVAAMFILFRETLEAAIIISVMLQLCAKMQLDKLKKWVWAGALSGLGLAILVGVVFVCLFYIAQQQAFKGSAGQVFTGCLMLVASIFITFLALVMLKVKGYEEKWQRKLQKATESGRAYGWWQIFLLAFTTTLREGLESVVFLTGVTAGVDPRSIPIGGIVGILIGIAVGVLLYYTGKSVSDIGALLIIMSVFLFFFAAGLTARGFTMLQFVGWFGYYGYPPSAQPWQNQQLWDWSHCCSMDINRNKFFGIIAALFGYTDSGTAIWLFAYFGYWVEVLIVLSVRAMRGTLLQSKKGHETADLPPLKEVSAKNVGGKEVAAPGTPPSPDLKAAVHGKSKLQETELVPSPSASK